MRYFLEKRITTYMVFAGLFLFGVIGLSKLPISLMPYTGYPGISIIIEYPGISPEKIETIITKPVEKIVKTVPGIEKIDSVSEDGKARINVNFQMDADVKIAALKVREKIGLIRGSFPRAVQEPVVIRYDPSDKPIIIATIARKGVSLEEMREIAERKVKPQLQRIEGISEINIAGGRQREIHIDLNQGRFEGRSLSFEKLFTTVQSGNVSLPGGLLAYGKREYVVYTPSRFKSIGEIADTAVLQTAQGSLVRLGDIGQVLDSYRDQEDIARLDGKENVTIYIQKAGDANILELCNSIVRLFSKLTEYEINVVYNQGRYIRAAITNVVSSCIWGVLIVIMVIYIFFRKLDYVITIGLTIPYTIVVVFACMYFAGVNIDIMSLSGVALGGGMIVDTSIIVTESIFSSRRINTETILGGIGYVRNAVVSSTVTTVIVFLPLVFGDILTQRMYGGMAFTITLALLVSLVVALLLVPAVYQELAIRAPRSKSSISRRSAVFDRLRPLLDAFFAQADSFERTMHQKYEKALGYVFGHPRTVLGVVAVMLAIATGSLFFIKSEFIDPMGTGEFYVYIEFPTGSTLEFANEASRKAEDHVKGLKVTEKISTKVEKMRATLSITLLEEVSSTKKRERIKARIRQDLNNLMTPYGGFAFLSEADEAASREFTITFLGDENETLRSIAKTAAGKIGAIKGIEECVLRFREGRPSYCLYLDREKANLSMLSARDVAGFFHNAVFGPVVTKFVAEDREVDVRVRYLK
ncbi:MAG TPA: efflux RND transporter permease subunit, partial [Spirochaetota bacterium]|nr:efflux RND transporter permease subunit [Spirochaetota bacterium]